MNKSALLTSRIESIDCLRGIVAAIMTLDHVRGTIHNVGYAPTDLVHTSVILFITRWITHFCAPIFVFLAGVSIYLSLKRGKTKKEMSKHLINRGIKLIFLDIAFVSVVMTGSLGNIYLQVLWVIGLSMIILAGLIWIKDTYVLALGLIMVVGHNIFDFISIKNSTSFICSILHYPQTFDLPMGISINIKYTLIPWLGVMALGYVFGKLMNLEQERRSKIFVKMGLVLTIGFFLLRGLNIYGDPNPWNIQKKYVFTVLSFLNTQKYPPSLSYLLMTLGPGILTLGIFEKKLPNIMRPFMVFGREPLRYYTLHMMMIGIFMGLNVVLVFILSNGNMPTGNHLYHSLPIVYLEWVLIVGVLYFIFVKKERKSSLKYKK